MMLELDKSPFFGPDGYMLDTLFGLHAFFWFSVSCASGARRNAYKYDSRGFEAWPSWAKRSVVAAEHA